jgi:co-chaperonin GroES (HSP10)
MNLTPLGNRIVILPDPKKTVSEGGLFIPEKAQKEEGRGTIVAISPDIEPNGLTVGDIVVYLPGPPYEEAGTTYHVVPLDNIFFRINQE